MSGRGRSRPPGGSRFTRRDVLARASASLPALAALSAASLAPGCGDAASGATSGEDPGALSVADRLEIQEVLARYCHCIDRGLWDAFVELFTADCRLDLSEVFGLFEGEQGLRRFAEQVGSLGLDMRHMTMNVVVRGDGARAEAEAYLLAFTGMPGSLQRIDGFYRDELVKRDGRWLLHRRRFTLALPQG